MNYSKTKFGELVNFSFQAHYDTEARCRLKLEKHFQVVGQLLQVTTVKLDVSFTFKMLL